MHAGNVCEQDDAAAVRVARKRKRFRASPDQNAKHVAAELLSWKCGAKCGCGGKCAFHLHTKVCNVVQQIVDARRQLHEAGRKRSSAVLFQKLLEHRHTRLEGKFVLNFKFAGLDVCADVWCAIHGLKTSDSRMKQMFASLRRGDCHWETKPGRFQGTRGWRGLWCRSWMRRHVAKFADFNPVKRTASLDPDGLEVRHLLYVIDWNQRAPGSRKAPPIKFSRFSELWKEQTKEGYLHDGEMFAIVIRPPRSGFTCDICQMLYVKVCYIPVTVKLSVYKSAVMSLLTY